MAEPHLSVASLENLARGAALASSEERHVEACRRCQSELERVRRDEALFSELRDAFRPSCDSSALRRAPTGADRAADATCAPPGYDIGEELHRGGQGVVYRAVQRATQRPVALKILLGGTAAAARNRRRFEREVDLAARLRHPNIVTVYDSGVDQGCPWYAMELVEGRPLDQYAEQTSLTVDDKLRLFHTIALAVSAAHQRGVIHRDLKPANILVDAEGEPHVFDFGVARESARTARPAERVTQDGGFVGTLAYASPEQVAGEADDLDTRTDVYALGLVLYELLTGELPYPVDGTVSQVIEHILHTEPRRPATLDASIDRELTVLLEKALAKDRDERYASADALARDVAHYLADEPLEARGHQRGYALRKALVRHRHAAALFGLAVLSIGGALGVAVRARMDAHAKAERAGLVWEVFQDVLSSAAPERMGAGVRLVEVYESAAQRIEEELVDAPDAQAAFHMTVGDTYRRLLQFREAESHLRRAHERLREAGDEEALARAEERLSLVLSALNSPEAIPLAESCLARRASLRASELDHARSERALAVALLEQYENVDHERAEQLLRSSLVRLSSLESKTSAQAALEELQAETAVTELWLARSLPAREVNRAEAVELLERSRDRLTGIGAAHEDLLIECLNDLSSAFLGLQRYEEAGELLARSVALTGSRYGPQIAVPLMRKQAWLRFVQGDAITAEELTRQALERELARWADKQPGDRERLGNLRRRLEEARPPEREPPYAEVFGVLREYRGNGAYELSEWMIELARMLRARGRVAATRSFLHEALNIHCRAFGDRCPFRFEAQWLLALACVDDEDPEGARPLLHEVSAKLERFGDSKRVPAAEVQALLQVVDSGLEPSVQQESGGSR